MHAVATSSRCVGSCGEGVCDEHRQKCECPMLYKGPNCEQPLLPACALGAWSLPIRSWVLHGFHDGAGAGNRRRFWTGTDQARTIGPVPCRCLKQFVSAPFLLERTRLQFMKQFNVRCIHLPPRLTLSQFIDDPARALRHRGAEWRVFSFGAAFDALRFGAEPTLHGALLDPPELGVLLRRFATEQPKAARRQVMNAVGMGLGSYHADFLTELGSGVRDANGGNRQRHGSSSSSSSSKKNGSDPLTRIPPLIVAQGLEPTMGLLPLSSCSGGCGGKGWCETEPAPNWRPSVAARGAAAAKAKAVCGCFVPHGLDRLGAGGPHCSGDDGAWRADRQPNAHWGPYCLVNCSGRGACDWHGFCRCPPGYYGIDCALTRRANGKVVIDAPSIEVQASAAEAAKGAPRPLTPIDQMLRSGSGSNSGGDGSGGHIKGRNLYYVVETPPLLRFGVDFAAHNEHLITERMLRSIHRSPTADNAANLWYTGAPLVIDGHRLLARLWHVATEWLGASEDLHELDEATPITTTSSPTTTTTTSSPTTTASTSPARRPLVLMPLLTERASMDSFQLSYSDDDREEWPALSNAPHVRGILARSKGCGLAAPPLPAAARREDTSSSPSSSSSSSAPAAAAAGGDSGTAATASTMPYADALRRLSSLLIERRRQNGRATLYGLFGDGGYQSFAQSRRLSGCVLPSSMLPSSTQRLWAGLQFSGNTRRPVYFQRGRDIVIPQMLLLRGVGSHGDQPSCEQMASTSPLSPAFARARKERQHANRSTLLWFGGHPGHGNARTHMLRLHSNAPGFVLLDTLRNPKRRVDPINMSLSSAYCWVPRGQGDGDPTRHMLSIFHGCVPVFTLGDTNSADTDALPFEELVPWDKFSIRVPQSALKKLPETVRAAATGPEASLKSMQAELGCAWRALFWTSLMGSCFGESARGDAFDTLMLVLRRRSREQLNNLNKHQAQSSCSVLGNGRLRLPRHLLDRPAAERAPGMTWK